MQMYLPVLHALLPGMVQGAALYWQLLALMLTAQERNACHMQVSCLQTGRTAFRQRLGTQ